ncbi:MAG: hypothetical protein DWG76_06875 [Chloroflexi bacterium]|nr:hypothetical protein [Chloroflexota bacterium]
MQGPAPSKAALRNQAQFKQHKTRRVIGPKKRVGQSAFTTRFKPIHDLAPHVFRGEGAIHIKERCFSFFAHNPSLLSLRHKILILPTNFGEESVNPGEFWRI